MAVRFFFNNLNGIIVNYHWYSERVKEIDSWSLNTFGYQPREGLSLSFNEESHKMLFILRWA